MTVFNALKKLQNLLYEDDDMISQENLFEAQELIDALVEAYEERRKNK